MSIKFVESYVNWMYWVILFFLGTLFYYVIKLSSQIYTLENIYASTQCCDKKEKKYLVEK